MSSPSSKFHKIGTITVPGGEIRKSYEVAAWWTRFVFETQTVDLHTNGYYVSYTVHGRDVETYTPALFGGVAVNGGSPVAEDKPSTYNFRSYHYTYAEYLAGDLPSYMPDGWSPGEITLDPGVTVESTTFDHPVFCRGYESVFDPEHPKGTTGWSYEPCEHEYHLDHRGERAVHRTFRGEVIGERNDRGHLHHGYVPSQHDTKVHWHFAINGKRV